MLRHKVFISLLSFSFLLIGCKEKGAELGKTKVVIETNKERIVLRLYDDTPQHRDNFIRLAKSGIYDHILWHRVVNNSLIQSGDPTLQVKGFEHPVDTSLYQYTVPAEIHCPQHFHKAGALAAARQPDSINPGKLSDATQFYIVSGQIYSPTGLAELHDAIYQAKIQSIIEQLRRQHASRLSFLRVNDNPAYQSLQDSIQTAAEKQVAANPPASYTETQKRVYTSKGGSAHLDGEYTVFGEVVEGLNVVQALGATRTDAHEHPMKEIYIRKVTVK